MDTVLSFIHTPCLLAAPILVHHITRNYPTTKPSNYPRNHQTIQLTTTYQICKTLKLAINYPTLYNTIMEPSHQADRINGHSFIIHTHTLLACLLHLYQFINLQEFILLPSYPTIKETIKLSDLQETIQLVKLSNQR